jgi:hypothetical protein
MVGTSGSSGNRFGPVMASTRILPPCASGITIGGSANPNSVCPAAMLSIISLVLL